MQRFVLMICMVLLVVVAQAQTEKREPRPSESSLDVQETQALTNDLARMRSLVHQMEMNLAFVQSTQTPLKHQFELEMDAWRVVLDGMERRLQRLKASSRSGVALPDTVPLRPDSRQGRP